MKVRYLIPVLLVLVGCSEPMPRNLDSLIQEGDREVFTDPETMTLYSGPVFRLDADDSTRVVFRAVLRNGKPDGSFTDYEPEGAEASLGLYQEGEYRDGLKEGPFTNFYPSGIIRGEGSYRSGRMDGPYTSWHENGQLRQNANYSNGDLDGPYESYFENGQLNKKGYVSNGEWDGPFESYEENGQLRAKGYVSNGQWCGEWFARGETVSYDPCPSN